MSVKEDLDAVFSESMTTTAQVINLPSGISKQQAQDIIKALPLKIVMRDLGAVLAREIGNELMAHALRPADFSSLPDLAKMVAARVAEALAKNPEEFSESLLDLLRMKG